MRSVFLQAVGLMETLNLNFGHAEWSLVSTPQQYIIDILKQILNGEGIPERLCGQSVHLLFKISFVWLSGPLNLQS